jgi:GH15 family glucan-1,4-alpha-glucosidase
MYGIIGNGETCAFISIFNSLDWLCIPRFDSPTIFAKALDSVDGGTISLSYEVKGSILPFESGSQRYIEDTCALETSTRLGSDIIRAVDLMPFNRRRIWRIFGISGPDTFRLHMCLDPRPDYNRTTPHIKAIDRGVMISSKGQSLLISSSEPFSLKKNTMIFTIDPPMTLPVLLTYGKSPEDALKEYKKAGKHSTEYVNDIFHWRQYASKAAPIFELSPKLNYFYMRSLLVLKQLIYDRTGAIIAAPTTSLPEIVGKDCNWDYRFCWVRDGAYSSEAFSFAGLFNDSKKILDFLLKISKNEGKPYPYPLVSIDGDLKGTKEELLDSLTGFGNSKPVRIGNKAAGQKQNDLEGEVIHAIYVYYKYSGDIDYIEQSFNKVRLLASYVKGHWKEKDAGIWEFRREYMNYVHSKTMCWAALEYGARLAKELGEYDLASSWRIEADKIKADVIQNGWSAQKKCFKRAYEDDSYDASILAIPLMNMIHVEDPMVKMSVKSITDHLGTGGLIKRFEDETGAFMLSSLWLAQVMMKKGKVVNALDIINRAARYASSDLGLFAEEYDMYYRRLVGNIPQSFSHEEFVRSVHYLLGKE